MVDEERSKGPSLVGPEGGLRSEVAPPVSEEGAARLVAAWKHAIQAVVDAHHGDDDAEAQLEELYAELNQRPDWRALEGVLRRIVRGERSGATLLAGLDVIDTIIVRAVLAALSAPHPSSLA